MEHNGVLFGWIETGTEGMIPALQEFHHIKDESWSYDGLITIEPNDKLIVYLNDEEVLSVVLDKVLHTYDAENYGFLIKENDFFAGWVRYPLNPQYGKLCLNGIYVHWLPLNVDLKLWYDIFVETSKYTGKIIRKKKNNLRGEELKR